MMKSASLKGPSDAVVKPQKKKSVACRRCHTHKIKCSGGKPCVKCRQAGCPAECTYVNRDRQIKIHESYLEQLAAENERLREQLSQSPGFMTADDTLHPRDTTVPDDTHVQNPMLGERGWFQPYDPSSPPIHIGEAACTAFATRLRQVLTKSKTTAHMPRVQYTPEATLMKIRNPGIPWPSLPQARLLIQVVFSQVSRVYHLVLRRSTTVELEEAYRKSNFDDPVLTCKFFALFALGEVYSARSNSNLECGVPGAAYYVNAMTLIAILPERPSLAHIESLLLLSLYSYFLNRRHSGFLLVGNAMRLGLTLGLHHDIPECQCPNPVDRQHRIRLWWVIYVFDRMYGSKVGFPIQLADDDIFVELPSDVPSDDREEQFSDTRFLIASIQLARITGQVIEKLYSRKKQADSFLQREQTLLLALKQWFQGLPPHIRLNRDGYIPKNVVSLHLQFNQCIMLATRPILLYTLIQSRCSKAGNDKNTIQANEQTLKTLADACIHAARHTHSLIVEEWTNGSMPIYGQIHTDNCNDFALFESAAEILRAMSDHGNLAATEFHDNLECVRQCLSKKQGSHARLSLSDIPNQHPGGLSFLTGAAGRRPSEMVLTANPVLPDTTVPEDLTSDVSFLGQDMEEFLALPDVDFGPLDPLGMPTSVTDSVYSWPNYSLWTA